ncbi:MAG TPA: type 1 glutamine amidotransferase [Thermoleophilaceae bacterium]|nr:type 1 glutamine amidotransferase [Thermoleophilaceae bacterium]
MRLLVLQHIACEPPAAYEDELREWGAELIRVEVDEGEPLPDWREFAGIVAMGGPMGAYEDDAYDWLPREKELIAEAVRADVPFWGVCLGSQLLAASLGARVYPGERAEVGLLPVTLTGAASDDPVFAGAPREFPTLQWHGDTFDLPDGATLLASSPAYPHQAFRVGRAYALQFHIEVSAALAAEWGEVPAYAASLESLLGPGALANLVAQLEPLAEPMNALARRLFARWLGCVVGLPAATGAASA